MTMTYSPRASPSLRFLSKFDHTDYGHSWCRRCGITFDSNVNDVLELSTVGRLCDLDESEFRARLVKTSRISTDAGVIYPKFEFADNKGLQAGITRSVVESVSRYFDQADRFRMLDLGCGNGFTTKALSEHFRNAEVLGLDPGPQVTVFAEKLGFAGVQGTLETMKFSDGAFDVVAMIGNLMLHADPFATLKEVKRILRPKGVLAFDVKNGISASRILSRVAIRSGVSVLSSRLSHYLERNFVNMRFGLNKSVVQSYLKELGFSKIEASSKAPRLLESQIRASTRRALWVAFGAY